MIITKARYEALLDTITELNNGIKLRDQYIENLRKDIKVVTHERDMMLKVIQGQNPFDIDYPNKDKGVKFR